MITQFFVINNNITFILPHSVQHSEYRIEGMGGKNLQQILIIKLLRIHEKTTYILIYCS